MEAIARTTQDRPKRPRPRPLPTSAHHYHKMGRLPRAARDGIARIVPYGADGGNCRNVAAGWERTRRGLRRQEKAAVRPV